MIVRDNFHRLLNELVSLIFQSLAIAVFSRVDTTTEVVVLWWWGGRSVVISMDDLLNMKLLDIPITI